VDVKAQFRGMRAQMGPESLGRLDDQSLRERTIH
jgi:hypothetical protein